MAQLVSRHSCVADRLPVVVRFPAGPRVRLKTVDPLKGNELGPKKKSFPKQILSPTEKILIHSLSGLKTSVGV